MTLDTSFDTYRERFHAYASGYDREDGRVRLKIVHTDCVVSIMEQLCERRGLPEHTAALAMLCALFHDIGRFEQLRRFSTFLDPYSCNHAELSCHVLAKEQLLDGLSEPDRIMVMTAIRNHNRFEIEPEAVNGSPEGLELCKLIRDADKCDIFRVFATENMEDVVEACEEEITAEAITPAVRSAVLGHRCVEKTLCRTHLDTWISFLAFFYDFNYPESMAIAREQGYYRAPFDRACFQNTETAAQIREILSEVELYVSSVLAPLSIPAALSDFFLVHPKMALAFSGGADSAYLLYAMKECGCDVQAYYVSTPFQPQFELDDAKRLARLLGVPMTVLPVNVLEQEAVRKNPADRCYFCKNVIFQTILSAAKRDGFTELSDGTNASDDDGDRPGMRALRELEVLSPLRECGITKKALRFYSRNAGLFTWNKPAYACLATRIPSGTSITPDMLARVEWAEQELTHLGLSDFRVRIQIDPAGPDSTDAACTADSFRAMASSCSSAVCTARLQITEAQFPFAAAHRQEIYALLKVQFSNVFLDLEARPSSVVTD